MQWPWEMVEAEHLIQNPTSVEKIQLLAQYMRLDEGKRVLDVGCGKAGPARLLASSVGCVVQGVELRAGFVQQARSAISADGLDALVSVEEGDGQARAYEQEAWDAAMCLGAGFIWGHINDAAAALVGAVKPGGYLAIGEPYWRTWPLPGGRDDEGLVALVETAERFQSAGVALTGVIAASEDDWDRYESLHWRALEEWLADNPLHPDAAEMRARHQQARDDYLGFQRSAMGWAIFVGRKG